MLIPAGRALTVAVLAAALLPAGAAADPRTAKVLSVVADSALDNASGLALTADGKLLTLQDARRSTALYALDRRGRTAYTVELPPGSNEDWEDLATGVLADGRRIAVIADTGDASQVRAARNQAPRRTFRLIQLDEPDGSRETATGIHIFRFRYPDGKSRNVETLLLQPGTGRMYLVTKTRARTSGQGGDSDAIHQSAAAPAAAELWALPARPVTTDVNVPELVTATLPVPAASGGAFSVTGDRFVIRNGTDAYVWWVPDGDVAGAVTHPPVRVHLPPQRQGEGVTFTRAGHALLVGSEGVRQPIWQVPLPGSADTARTPRPSDEAGGAGGTGGFGKTPLAVFAVLMLAAAVGIGVHRVRLRRAEMT
ncbi:hypothetical protein LO762_01175 [Actinocorallia sp. API 0066]|uniref:hypothetical protein n=1 Tax=Actinocorallia sp. API 0066 TaxID=2896846 RepID=UPI001E3A6868|nr:hypothetical protein [Actinocorallia sp. API 0066]MCD0447812.1 hypothetical protein [Actinocorallia sp. API 0066]